ncbi:uncharacterized protein K02A2.6-like [Topomyia yanbarensis]|uniref:uncharacterized protein K02A2.6-like n=1 Tax=Topomyia yanbarensis TaxID=2498891 RepID=UPI00273ACBD4|nr:uncharacterized protein K02A2.6-like [Topomyia yanbarensis]
MSRILEGVENIIVYIDDILMFAETLEDLHKTVSKVLEILKENNLTINTNKCEFDKTRISFLGHELDENGFNIDEAKIKDIRRFRPSSTVSELRSFLSLASFISPYIQGIADTASPLWAITSSNAWVWASEQQNDFDKLKEQIVNCRTSLGYFTEDQKTIIYTDASPNALGAVLVQQGNNQPPRVIATEADQQLQDVMHALETGVWPMDLRNFEILSGELSMRDGLLVKTGCAVIPENLWKKTLSIAHEGHPSTAKFKNILRQRVWWPGMSKAAEAWINSCSVCTTNGKPEKLTPMDRVFAPKSAWETIAVDFNGPYSKFDGVSILVIVDYRSRYIIAKPVRSTSFENTRKILDMVFDKEGFPECIKSDNGPLFNGEE